MNKLDERTITLKTICRDCIFAEFTEDYVTQTGCKLGRLDKYIDRGQAKIIDDKLGIAYYEINTICNTCRNKEWANKFDDHVNDVKKQIQPQLDYIILCDSISNDWVEEIITTTKNLLQQTLKPKKIIYLFYRKKAKFTDLSIAINTLCSNVNVKYEILNIIEYVHNTNELIDHAVKKSNSQYYCLIENNEQLEEEIILKINKKINEDLEPISMILPKEDGLHMLVVQKLLHETIGGNRNIPVKEKIEEIAKNQNAEHMIKSWKNLNL